MPAPLHPARDSPDRRHPALRFRLIAVQRDRAPAAAMRRSRRAQQDAVRVVKASEQGPPVPVAPQGAAVAAYGARGAASTSIRRRENPAARRAGELATRSRNSSEQFSGVDGPRHSHRDAAAGALQSASRSAASSAHRRPVHRQACRARTFCEDHRSQKARRGCRGHRPPDGAHAGMTSERRFGSCRLSGATDTRSPCHGSWFARVSDSAPTSTAARISSRDGRKFGGTA